MGAASMLFVESLAIEQRFQLDKLSLVVGHLAHLTVAGSANSSRMFRLG